MTREQMEEAVEEARELLARHADGTLKMGGEPVYRRGAQFVLTRLLDSREAWLRGEVIRAGVAQDIDSQQTLAIFRMVEESAEMLDQAEGIAYLRGMKSLNHEPLRPVEQNWLDRIFFRGRVSKGWIKLALVGATAEETGIHLEDQVQMPCRCPDRLR